MTSRKSVGEDEPTMEDDDAFVYVFDRRESDVPEVKIPTGGLFSFVEFKKRVQAALNISPSTKFIIATTDREEIRSDDTWDIIDKGDTLYVLNDLHQELCAPAQERVNYLPHYDTIVKGGMYEYYASEGQNPLPYAFAELIDNSLAATANNIGHRKIEIRLYLDDGNPKNCGIYVIDNGKGMTPRQLNNWAIYRLSKFIRKDQRGKVIVDGSTGEDSIYQPDAPRSLNSDISYFGVGGKQAVFFIGNSTRMLTRPRGSQDVHELTISKEEFEMKEKNHEAIYSGFIRNRKPGDISHLPPEDEVLIKLVEEETGRESFTMVAIQGINPDHVTYLKQRLKDWTRQLAHIYHFYIHGPNGNVKPDENSGRIPSPFKNIDIQIKMYSKGQTHPKIIDLRDIDDDMQTLYVRNSASTFEFKAVVEGSMKVEGILRYHPFMYDRETYPSDMNDPRNPEDDHGYAISETPARGRRPIFECYWNGRLIPYTLIEDFEWCSSPKKMKTLPIECYNRISGVLWTDDKFQVSTNKLTFIDLEMKLRDKQTTYSRIINGQEKRTSIEKEFINWLKECHEQLDKQIHFSGFQGKITRSDLPKHRQFPWCVYKQVEWDAKVFKDGQLVRIMRTLPILHGTINRILLFGDYDGDVYATGGDLEITQEPRSLYADVKIVPLSKLDRLASPQLIKKYIEEEEAKLPDKLVITWPDGFEVTQNEKRPAGKTIGDMKVEILNKKGEKISKLPGTAAVSKKLLVELKVIWHAAGPGDQVIVSHISQHGKNWPYWFRKMENIKNMGNYTLQLQVVLNESGGNTYAGKELPSHKIKFSVTEAEPEKFTIGLLEGPFRVGVPFNIPLDLHDEFNNPTKPTNKLKPTIEGSGLDLQFIGLQFKGNTLVMKDVVAKGTIPSSAGKIDMLLPFPNQYRFEHYCMPHTMLFVQNHEDAIAELLPGQNFNITVKMPGLPEESQSMKIRLLPGPPAELYVEPEDEITIENGTPVSFKVQLRDVAGNVTSVDGKQSVVCKLTGAQSLPSYSMDCSSGGTGTLTGDPIFLKKIKEGQIITAKIDLQGYRNVKSVERRVKVIPSGRISDIVLSYQKEGKTTTVELNQEIQMAAGETLEGFSMKLIDEAGRDVEIDDKLANKIKINWASKPPKDILLKGQLPGVRASTLTQEIKYCHINVVDCNVDFSFLVKAIPGEPNTMKCQCLGNNTIGVGQYLGSNIQVQIKDKFGNDIEDMEKIMAADLEVKGENLIEKDISIAKSKGGLFVINNVKFSDGKLGRRELQVSWKDLKDYVKLEMVVGPASQLAVIDYDPEQVIMVYNENKLPSPLVVQLFDSLDNPVKEADVKIQITKDPKIKFIPTPGPVKTNKEGKADFGIFTVTALRGTYEIQPKAFRSNGVIAGPKLKIMVQPDPTRPSEMKVEYDNKAAFVAGEKMPDVTVKVYAEDEQLLTTAKSGHISMKLWKSEPGSQDSMPSKTVSFTPDITKKQTPGTFVFRDKKLPEEAGSHNIMFVYYDGKHQVFSNVIHIAVDPATPTEIFPIQQPGTPTVSNTRNVASRCVLRNLQLQLRDKYGNHVTKGMNGSVQVEILSNDHTPEIPKFVGNNTSLNLTLAGGVCNLQNLTLQESCPGVDGQEYILRCTVICNNIPKTKAVPPYDISFLFYNDAKKQSQMAHLSKERDNLQNAIRTYKSLFETTEQLIGELKISVKETEQEVSKIKTNLSKYKVNHNLVTVEGVEKQLQLVTGEKDLILNSNRRICGLQPAPMEPDVLGKIGHLALIEDQAISRVLSWHMSSDMDCVVTLTSNKAKEIYHRTNGKQQVLPLDSIYKKNLTEWKKPLPHVKFKQNWQPPGNPVYARDLLEFTQDMEKCRIVFAMLLGDTLILDDLDTANAYRQEIVKFTHCPTILTRDGDRIRSNGKFGGLMNKALPLEKLRGAVFGSPLPKAYHEKCTIIETLQSLKTAIEKHESAKAELQEQIDTMQTQEMQAKYQECKEAEKQLSELEEKLGMGTPPQKSLTSPRSGSKSATALDDPKKQLQSPAQNSASASAVNGGTPNSFVTPTRASKRIAHMTPVSDDGRKRLRRN